MPTFTSAGWRSARDARKAKKAGSTRVEPTASVEGTWNVVVKSPAGPMPTTLLLERVNGELTGSKSGQGMTTPITDVKVDGNNIVWQNEVQQTQIGRASCRERVCQ